MQSTPSSIKLTQSMGPKILATLGPSTSSIDVIREMIKQGVSGFRLNFAFGTPETWSSYIKYVREASSALDTVVSIIGDIPGPQVRTTGVEPISLNKDDIVVVTYVDLADEYKRLGKVIPVDRRELFEILQPGDTILYGDGEVELRVIEASVDHAKCITVNPGVLKPGRKIVVPGKELPTSFLSARDIELIKYACSEDLTYIALSYVRSEKDVLFVRDLLRQFKCNIGLISKIETPGGLRNAEKIAEVSDALLVARGDLGVHFPIESIPLLQDRVVQVAVKHGVPVIVATDVLESMIESNRPSRSDVVGLYNIVYSLVDAVLLTNETSIGKYPVEAAKWARVIISTALSNMQHVLVEEFRRRISSESLIEKYAQGLIHLAESLGGAIIVYSKTGRMVPLLSRHRPLTPVYIGSWSRKLMERSTIYYGLNPVDLSSKLSETVDYERGVEEVYSKLRDLGVIKIGDIVVKSYSKPVVNQHEIRVEVVV